MWRAYRDIKRGEYIVVAADGANGGRDRTSVTMLSKSYIDVPVTYCKQATLIETTPLIYQALLWVYRKTGIRPLVAFEREKGGDSEMERLARLNRSGCYDIFKMLAHPGVDAQQQRRVKLGWETNAWSRPRMLGELKEAIDHQVLLIYEKEFVEECFSFVEVQTSVSWRAQAETGAYDDRVLSTAIAWQLFQNSDTAAGKADADYQEQHQFNVRRR